MTPILPFETAAQTLPVATTGCPELCVVVPVLNEEGNVAALVEKLRTTLVGIAWEVMFVDDGSRDGTRDAIATIGAVDNRVRLLYRVGRRGLASAFIEGAQATLAPYVAAMDGDLQHDEALLPKMLAVLRANEADVVIGSRYVPGGDLGDWDKTRAGMSGFATRLGQVVLRTPVADPMSGFFMLPRQVFLKALPNLSAIGFKILLDVLASLPDKPRVVELPFKFRTRLAGESKLDAGVLLDFVLLLADKMVGSLVPVRFLLFAAIGALGLVFHVIVLRTGLQAGLGFEMAQAIATLFAIAGNFWLNNRFTFRDRRLRGPRLLPGFIVFTVVCGVGAWANLSISAFVMGAGHQTWWAAGLAGAAMSLVWNYAVGSTLTWQRRPMRRA
jgi:dolichol-phosphate mannosyltransferase